jgi:hypothetical protein
MLLANVAESLALRARSPQELQSSTAEKAPAKELSQPTAASTGTMKDCVRLLLEKQCKRLPLNGKVWSNAVPLCMQQFGFAYFEKDTPLMSAEVRQSSKSWQFWHWTVLRNHLSHSYPFADISCDVSSQDPSSKKQKRSSEAAKVQAKQDMWWDDVTCHDILTYFDILSQAVSDFSCRSFGRTSGRKPGGRPQGIGDDQSRCPMMSHVCWEMLGIYPGETNIDVETYGFPRKVICKWWVFHSLINGEESSHITHGYLCFHYHLST